MYSPDRHENQRPVIAVIGGGASGTLTAIHLLRLAAAGRPPVRIALIDAGGRHGLGQAYSTTHPGHLLNSPASTMRDGVYFSPAAIDEAALAVARLLAGSPDGVTVAEVRDTLGTSRKYILPLLAHLDALLDREADVRGAGGPEDVHRMRVATRRLRAAARSASPDPAAPRSAGLDPAAPPTAGLDPAVPPTAAAPRGRRPHRRRRRRAGRRQPRVRRTVPGTRQSALHR